MKQNQTLHNLFSPESVAVVGASDKEGKVGCAVTKNVLNLGFGGSVHLVNPKYKTLFGKECYGSLAEIPSVVDVAIIIVPAPMVTNVIESGLEKARHFVVISAGFSEIGTEGLERERVLVELGNRYQKRILGPNCLGFMNPSLKLNASFAGGMPKKGNVALVSQSGALAVALLDGAQERGLGFSKVVSVGNKADIDESVMLEYLADDDDTDLIMLYLEGIKDGSSFIQYARHAVKKNKSVIVLKAGRSERTQKAISSHTGALAGSDEAMTAAFKKAGVIRAETIEDFFALAEMLSHAKWRQGIISPIAVVTNAGGPGVLTADAFTGTVISLAELDTKTKKNLRAALPAESSVENPIDLLGDAGVERYESAIRAVASDRNVKSIHVILTPQDQTPVEEIARCVVSLSEKTDTPISTSFIGGKRVRSAVEILREGNIPHTDYPELTVRLAESITDSKGTQFPYSDPVVDERRKASVARMIDESRSLGKSALLYQDARTLATLYGIPVSPGITIRGNESLSGLEIPFPWVVKIDSDTVLHKTDKKGVYLNVSSNAEATEAVAQISSAFPGEQILIQPMLPVKHELIVGMKRDPVFGSVIIAGLGGIYTEILKRANVFIPPLSREEIAHKLGTGPIGFLFRETRGQSPCDINEVSGIIESLSVLAFEAPDISEIDINPLLVYNDGTKAVAVDVKIILGK